MNWLFLEQKRFMIMLYAKISYAEYIAESYGIGFTFADKWGK